MATGETLSSGSQYFLYIVSNGAQHQYMLSSVNTKTGGSLVGKAPSGYIYHRQVLTKILTHSDSTNLSEFVQNGTEINSFLDNYYLTRKFKISKSDGDAVLIRTAQDTNYVNMSCISERKLNDHISCAHIPVYNGHFYSYRTGGDVSIYPYVADEASILICNGYIDRPLGGIDIWLYPHTWVLDINRFD